MKWLSAWNIAGSGTLSILLSGTLCAILLTGVGGLNLGDHPAGTVEESTV